MCVFLCLSHVDQSREKENDLAPCIVSDVIKDKMTKVEVRLGKYKKEHIFPEYIQWSICSFQQEYVLFRPSLHRWLRTFIHFIAASYNTSDVPTKLYFKKMPSKSITSSWKGGPGFKFLSTHYFPHLIIAETAKKNRRKMAKKHTLSASLDLSNREFNFLAF